MGVVSQVGLLLWKNLKLMIRNPLLAITQFFWPILIFVVIALVRNRVPPSQQTECHYNPQALPSVGTVDFMQSMMCDIESSCRSENIVPRSNEPPVFGASIGTLLDDLSPLLENGSTIESFQSLPSALAPLVNLTETLEETLELIREQNFYVKDFLLNETRLKEEISNKISRENAGEIIGSLLEARIDLLEFFAEAVSQPLLEAELDVVKLLDILGYGFSTSVFCNATMLEAYVLFPEGTDVEEIVEVLCGLDNSELEGLLAIILEEVDTRYIAEEVTAFLNAVEKYGLGNFTRDVLDLQERLADIADLGDFVDVLPQLLELARFIPDIQRFVEIIQGGSPQDILSSILDSLGIIREILDRQPGDIEWLETTKQILSVLTDLVSFLQDLLTGNVPAVGEIPFDDLLDGSNIEHLLGELNVNSSIIADFFNSRISLEWLAAFGDLLRNPDSLVRAYCHGNVSLEPLFSLPQGLDDTVLRGALCKGNTTRLLEAVLEELAELQHSFVFDLNGILGPLLNQTGQLGELFDDLPPFLRDFLFGFNTTQLDQLSPIFDLIGLFSNQTGADGFMDLLGDALAVMEGMFMQSTWWDEVRRQLAIQSVLLDAQISMWQNIHDGTFLEPLLLNPYSEAIELLLQLGPNVTEAVLSTFINPAKIEELMDLPPGELALVFCSDFIEYPAGLDVTYAREQLCKLSVNATWLDGVLYIGASLFPDVAHAIETYFVLTTANVSSPALSHYFENATFRNVLHKQQELQDAIWAALSQPIDLGAHFADLDLNITGTPDEWLAMLMRLQQAAAPQLQSNFLMGQFESIFESLEEIPEVQKLYAFQLAQDVMVQDVTIVLHAVNTLAYGEVPMYGGEIEKFLEGVVFLTQRGGAIQAAIVEAYEDPAKVLALADIDDSVTLLCNATLRQSLLELPEEDSQALDSTLCRVDYGLLGVEFMDLMQVEELQYLLNCAFHAEFNCSEPLYWNVTASTVLYTELLGQVELLGPALEKWVLVFNQTGLMAFLPALTPAQMADAWNMPWSFENITSLLSSMSPREFSLLVEGLLNTTVQQGLDYVYPAAAGQNAGLHIMTAINRVYAVLTGLSQGEVIPALYGTKTEELFTAILGLDHTALITAISEASMDPVLSQRLMQVTDWQAAFCNATLRDDLFGFTDKGVDGSLFEQTFCRADWDMIAQELFIYVDAESIIFWLEQVQNASTKPLFSEFDWEAQTAEQNLLAANLAGSWELMEAFAVQLNLSHVIAHGEELLTKYLIDQFGLTTGNDTDWSKELTTQLMDTWLLIDGQLSSLPGWGVYKANVYLLFATVEQLVSGNATLDTPEISLAMLVPNATELALVLSDTLALPVDVVYQLIMMPIDPSKLIEVVTTNSWNETLCGQGLLPLDLELPAGLNLTQLQRALCEVDFEDLIARLSRGEGIDHFISLLIAELRAFQISDDLTGWVSEFERILESLDLTSVQGFLDSFGKEFSTLVDNIDRMFVNATPGWDAFVANLDIITTVLQYTTPLWNRTEAMEPITLASLVPDADQLVEVLTPLAPLNPEIILAIINAEINPQALLEMAISGQWNETLCSEEALKLFFVSPESLNLTLIHRVLCSLDFQQSLTELMQDSAFQMIWSMIVDQLYLSIIPDFTIPGLDLQTLLPQIFTFVETLNPADLQSLEELQALFVNETWYQETVKQLQWMTALNRILSDKLIMLEGQEIIFPYLGNLLADAPELQRILLQDYQIAPGLVEAIFSLSLQPDKMLVFFNMTNPLLTLCASGQFSAFFYSPLNPDFDVAGLETAFCSIDFEDLTMELKEISSYDEILAQYELLIDPTVQVGTFNWTAYALSQEEWMETIQRLSAAPPSLTFDPAWQNKTVANLIALAERLNAAQQRLITADGMENLANLAELLESGLLNNQPWAVELEAALRTMNAIVAYSNDYLLRLPGRNITLNDLMPPYAATYLETNSDLAPDVITLLLHASVNTEAILARQGNRTWLETVCADIEDLPQLIEIPADIDLEAAHQALCSLDVEAFQLAYLQDLQEVIAEISSGNAVNFTALSQNFQTLAFAIQSLIENPPNLLKYNEEWFATTLGRIAAVLEANSVNNMSLMDPEFLSFVFADILRQIPSELLNSEPALLVPFRLSDYITSVLIDMLKMLQGQSFTLPTLDELFANATHVRELLGQSDVAPEIIDTFLSLSMQADKMTYLFITPNAFVQLCASGQFATFFTLPPDSPTDISVVEEVFCGTNVTVLLSELDDVLKFTDIQNEINRILSLDPTLPPFNQTAATLRQQELAALITALLIDPPQVVVDPAWWLTVSNRTEVILAQWLARLAEQSMSPDTIPGLDSLIAQLRMLEMTGESPQWFRTILAQLELSQYVSTAVTEWLAQSNGTVQMLPTFEELFPDPDIIRQFLAESGLPVEVVEGFMGLAPLSDQWINLFLTEEPFAAICQTSLFQDVFEQTVNATVDVQSIQTALCSINLTSIDSVLSSIFMSNRLTIELVQVLFNLPDVEVQLAINISQEASQIIQSLIANPLQYSTELARIIEILQELVPDLDVSVLQSWLGQVQLTDYINEAIASWIMGNNGTVTSIPTFEELFPDPDIIRQLLYQTGLPAEVVEGFLQMAPQFDQWVNLFASPDPLTALCETSFRDVFELSLNATVDIDAIQAQLCSVNLSSIDDILSTIFMSNVQIIEMAQLIFNLPEVDVQIAINISQEVAQIVASLTENPLEYTSALQRIVDLLQLYAPELDLSALESYLSQVQLMDYIEEAIAGWLSENNGTVTSIPTFEELFPDPDIIRQLLYQTGLPAEVVEGFLQMAPQFDQWTMLFSSPDPLAAVCNSSSFADIFDQFVNASVDIQTIQAQICSVNLTSIDAILNSIFMSNRIVADLVKVFFNVPEVEIQLAINASQEIAEILGSFLSNPSQYSIDYARIVELLQQFQVPGLNETWVQNWLAQVQLMEYVNDVLTQWIMNANGTAMPVPTFGELFPDPTVLVDLLRQLGLPEDMITAFLDSAIQADQWNQVWMSEDPLKTLCEAGLVRDTIAVAINSSVTAQAIQDSICSVNLTDVDDLLSSIFDLDALIIEVSRILFNDPTLDWEAALNLSRQLSENLQQLLASPPTTAEDIEQVSLSLLDGLEDILRMFGMWDKVRPYLSLTEVILGTAEHYLDITDDIIRTVLDPQAPLEDVTRYLNLTQEEIRIALLGDFIYLTYLADYYQSGQLDTRVCQEGYYNGVHLILRFNVGFINQTALQQYLCSADLQEFFADAKDLYGFDFLRWAEVSGSIFQDLKANHTVDSFADIASLVLDLTAMVQDLAALPEMLTGDIDVYTLITRVTSLSTALQAQEMELIIKSLEELEPFLNDPYVIGEIRTALMSGVALMQWSSNLPTDLDPVAWLQSAQEALVETGLWQQVLPIVNFVDLLIEGQLDSLMPLGFSLPHLLTNETVLNKFLTEALDMAPEYAEALLLSEINPIMTLAELHLSGEWEEVFCADVPQMMNGSEAEVYQVFNVSAIFSHLCHLNRTQFFEHVNSLLSIDILRLTEEFANLLNHSQTGPGSGQLYDWQSLVSNVQAIIDTYKTLFELDTFNPNVNHTQIEELLMRLQHGLNTFDMEVLFESMELLNNLLYLDGEWDQIKGYMNTVTSIVEWMNDQLDNIDAHNISLFEAITHHEMVLQNLYVTVYPEDFAILATSTVNTEIANSLQTHEDFERVLCDPAAFNMLLTPVFNASLETLQGTLCAALLAGHETLVDDLQTHFITAPLQQDLIVLATNNHNHGFTDQDLDMRHMINEIQELGDGLANSLMKEFSAVEPSWTVEEVVYEVMTGFNESVIMKMVFDAVAPTIMNLTIWSDYLHPIIGRLDLGMRMVDDLYFTLPERVGEINAILNDTALLTPAVEVILVEAPVAVAAWNDISGKAGDLLVTGGVLLRLLTGELQGVSSDPARLEQLLVDIGVEAEETSVDEFIVSLDKILLTDFVQELMAAFKIPENTQRLAIILDWSSTDDLPAWDVGFLERSTYFVRRVSMCYWDHTLCPAIDLELGQTLQLFASLIEIVDELQKQNLENLFDLFELIQPLLDGSLGHLNVSSDLEQTLSDVLDFLVTVYQDGMVDFSGVLPLLDFDEAFMNSSIVLQFLRENLGLTDLDLAHLRDGTLNTTLLLELLDMSSVDTAALLCRNSFVDDLLGNVDSRVVDHLVQGLCSNGSLIAVEFLRDNLDVETIIELINSDLQQTFPEFVLDLLGALSSVQRIDFTELGDFAVNVLLPIIQQGSVDFSDLEALGANINMTRRILESFDQVLTSFEGVLGGWPPFKDIQDLVRTLLDKLYIFEILGEIPDLSVDKILENPDRVRDYLVNRLDLSPETADNLMKAELNLEQLLESDFSEFLEELCGEMYLERILILPNQTDAAVVADTLCSLNGQELAILIELFIPYVDINGIIEKAESAQDLTGMIGVSNRTIVQVIQSMDSLQSVTKALPALESALSDLSEDPALERLQDLAQLDYLTGEEISVITQEIVCGRSSLRRRRRSADEVLERSKRTTISDNDDNFCQNIFSSIVNGINGQLVWAYLKPIVEGLILYSPDTEPVRRIIAEANKTFADVAMVQEFAQIWLSSEEDLTKLLDPAALDATRTLLENSFVSGLLEAEYGIVSSDFTDLLDGDLTTITQSEIDTLTLLAELVNNLTTCFNLDRFVGYSTEEEMVEAARSLDQQNTLLAALAFDIPADATEIPRHVVYKIRMDTDNTPPTDRISNRNNARGPIMDFVFDLRYLRGFIMLQDMVERGIIALQAAAGVQTPGVYLQPIPYPCHQSDLFTFAFAIVLPLIVTVSFVILIGAMTHQLVYEKERGIEELMKAMGMAGGANWWAWFISSSVVLAILAGILVLIMKVSNILPLIQWTLLLVFFLDFFFSIIMYCYLASAIFQRANLAALASILVYLMMYLPYLGVFASDTFLQELWEAILLGLFSPSTFSMGCFLISQFESLGTPAGWDNLWVNPLDQEVTSMALVLILLACDGALYFLLGWYIKTLFPGKYGVPRPWYFPLQPSYWCRCYCSSKRDMTYYINSAFTAESGVTPTGKGSAVEEEPSLPLGVAIKNLTKIYRSCCRDEKVAVDNLTLNFFEGQVTALLGHNGAGKTTTINIITGLFSASSGEVVLQGLDIAKKTRATRKNLGVCVQHNALYEDLTVREHMVMAGRVKGLSGRKLDDDIFDLLEDVGLLKKSEQRVKNLSGGMKRKLSVAMALVGDSKVVILDEPTSGVDPHARRAIWNLIMKHKTGRTIILCTHFMDEADILGDRIAILDRGHLRCCGSPGFLKSSFSSGYRLSLAKEVPSTNSTPTSVRKGGRGGAATPDDQVNRGAVPNIYDTMKRDEESDRASSSSGIATDPGSLCDTSQVTEFIKTRIPSAQLQEDIGTELIFSLPVDNGERQRFQELFWDLDENMASLHVKSYGISDTTLKEVFLKVSTERSREGAVSEPAGTENWTVRSSATGEFQLSTGVSKALQKVWGLIVKRLHFIRRDWRGFIWSVLMPVTLVALAVGFAQLSENAREVELQLTPTMFNKPDSYVFFSHESSSPVGEKLLNAFLDPPGLGTTCLEDSVQMDAYSCDDSESNSYNFTGIYSPELAVVPPNQCNCTTTGIGVECSPNAGGVTPPQFLTDLGIYLQDITPKRNKNMYLVDTQLEYQDSRYGGVSWFDVQGDDQTTTQAKAWFNNRGIHAMPTFLNVMNNIILRATVDANASEFGITAYNHPLSLSKEDLGTNVWLEAGELFGITLIIVAAFALIPSAFAMFLIDENLNGSKRLHYVSGVGTFAYWSTNLLWDMLIYCIPVGLIMAVLKIFEYGSLISLTNIGPFASLALLYGFAMLCQIYLFISLFKNAGTAFIVLFCSILLSAVVTNMPNWLIALETLSEEDEEILGYLNWAFLAFTPFCLSSGLLDLIQNQITADIYGAFGVDEGVYQDPFELLKWKLVALAAEGALAFLLLLIVDGIQNSSISSCIDPSCKTTPTYQNNEDVMDERSRVLTGGSANDLVTMADIRKVYRGPARKKIVAVNDLCLGVPKGECFGLLGVNGAGKTTTFRMITRDLAPTSGSIKNRALSVGYCPQENAMYQQLTGRELLYCYARIKGIPSKHTKQAVADIAMELGMESYIKKRISTYSGGMKRSLAVAVALLGRPDIVLMDEPTTGMDPITKQRVLNSIVNVVKDNRSVILTSHSMEECEAVCTRLAIMVNGHFCCLGSPQHVRHRHGNGYSLVVRGQKTSKTDMPMIIETVQQKFPGAELKEHHHNMARFQLPPQNTTVASIFGVMEQEQGALNLEDYSVTQTTLDDVFVNFAKQQTDGLEDDTDSQVSVGEVSIINRAFEPDIEVATDTLPRNKQADMTKL